QFDRDHAAALADREDAAIVDHRIGVDVGKLANRGGDAGARQRVLPDNLTVFITISGKLARRETGDEGRLGEGRRRGAEHTGQLERAGARPAGLAILRIERIKLAVLAQHIDIVASDGRGAAQWSARLHHPDLVAGRGVERGDVAGAVGRIDAPAVIGDAAAEQGLAGAALAADLMRPDFLAVLDVEGA